jgi:hypothetical protein
MLAGEAGRRQVFHGGRAAHSDRDAFAVFAFERPVGFGDAPAQSIGVGRAMDDVSRLPGLLRQQRRVGDVDADAVEPRMQSRPDVSRGQGVPIGAGHQGEAVRDAHRTLSRTR